MAGVVGIIVLGPAEHRILAVQAVVMKTIRMNKRVCPLNSPSVVGSPRVTPGGLVGDRNLNWHGSKGTACNSD